MVQTIESSYQPIDDSLKGRVALVTGGSRGIGRATCYALAQKGAAVAVHYSSSATEVAIVAEQVRNMGVKAITVQGDLGDASTAERIINETVAALGSIDILVSNAAVMTDNLAEQMPDDEWNRVIDVNLSSVFRCARASIPHMKARSWGRIINITSQSAYRGSRYHAHYTAAKSGLIGLTFSLARELAGDQITANIVSPGRIATDMLLDRADGRMEEWMSQIPLKRLGDAAEVASAITFLASDGARYITGSTIHVNGGAVMS